MENRKPFGAREICTIIGILFVVLLSWTGYVNNTIAVIALPLIGIVYYYARERGPK